MRDPRRTGVLVAVLTALLLAISAVGLLTADADERDRAAELERRLRCPVCKTVSIAESPSDTAAAARELVREQVAAGRTDEEVLQYFRQRYGEWILLDPEPVGRNLLLWGLPVLAAVGGLAMVLTRRDRTGGVVAVPPDVRERIETSLDELRGRSRDDRDAP